MGSPMEDIASEAESLVRPPTDRELEGLVDLGKKQLYLEKLIKSLEQDVKDRKAELIELSQHTLPDLMARLDVEDFSVSGMVLQLRDYYKANIVAEWDAERQERAFAHLESLGGGDIVKTTLSVSAGRGSLDKMERIRNRVVQMCAEEELDAVVSLGKSVPWNTLTAWVRGHVESGSPGLQPDLLGATIGKVVKVKKKE